MADSHHTAWPVCAVTHHSCVWLILQDCTLKQQAVCQVFFLIPSFSQLHHPSQVFYDRIHCAPCHTHGLEVRNSEGFGFISMVVIELSNQKSDLFLRKTFHFQNKHFSGFNFLDQCLPWPYQFLMKFLTKIYLHIKKYKQINFVQIFSYHPL